MTARNHTATAPAISKLRHAGFFCLRTPLLPFDELTAWSAGLDAATDLAGLRVRLRAIVERPDVREAIFIASPSLAGEIDVWLREPTSERGEKVERGLVRYFSRMCGRATPFGQFAGCSVGTVGSSTALVIDPVRAYRSHTRLDMNYVCALADDLLRLPAVNETAVYRPNSSLYRVSDQYRYMEWRADAKGQRTYGLIAVPVTDYLERVLAHCATGARRDEIIELLASADPELTHDEVAVYVAELIASQVLVADFPPRVTGREPLAELIARTDGLPGLEDVTAALRDALDTLAEIDASELGDRSAQYARIVARLGTLPTPIDAARVFHVDMVKPAPAATLGIEVIAEIERAVALLHRLVPTGADNPLSDLVDRFVRRYESREVPLAEALDEEWGITPQNIDPSPLLAELPFTPRGGSGGESMHDLHGMLLREIHGAVARDARVLELDERKLASSFTDDPAPMPSALFAMVTVIARSAEAVARGEFHVLVEGAKGPSGVSLLGRFCHADPEMERRVTEFTRAEAEADPDAIYAEIVHQPQSRVGNIIARPVLTEYEIVYLGQSGLPIDKQLPVSDLLVSVVGGRFVLRSKRLGREVIPRLTTAHTLFGGLMTYRFLGQLASAQALALRMGPLERLPFIPRVVVGRAVLYLATWRLFRDEIAKIDRPTQSERFAAVQALRAARKMPRFVAVKDLDNELPIDLDNALSVNSFVHLVKQRPFARLQEVYPGADELCAEGPEGRFVHELVVPFLYGAGDRAREPLRDQPAITAQRQFAPGSEWLYAKLYTGISAGDRVLCDVVAPVVEQAAASGACDRWFFLRYADPDFHIRVRFHGEPGAVSQLIPALHERCAPLVAEGFIHRVQLDTYDREIERYGGDAGIELAEQLFRADSEAALAVVSALDAASELDERWRFALLGIDLLLGDLRLDLAQRRQVIHDQRVGFGAEYAVTTGFERSLGAKFRNERLQLEAMLGGACDGNLAFVRDAFRRRSEQSRAVVDELIERERTGRLTVPVAELAKSFIHMHANRCLRSAARPQELVIYDFLERCYTSQVARTKPPRCAKAAAAQAAAAQL